MGELIFDVSIPSDKNFDSILFEAVLLNPYSVNKSIIMNVGKNNPGSDTYEYEV